MPGVFHLLTILCGGILTLVNAAVCLECYQCLNVSSSRGEMLHPLMQGLLREHLDQECATVADTSASAQCPQEDGDTYYCGYIHAEVTAFANKVGRLDLVVHIRDCFKMPDNLISGCYQNDKLLPEHINNALPRSLLATQPRGKMCLCQEDGCVDTISADQLHEEWCSMGSLQIGASCVDWWVLCMASIDTVLIIALCFGLCCYVYGPRSRRHCQNAIQPSKPGAFRRIPYWPT